MRFSLIYGGKVLTLTDKKSQISATKVTFLGKIEGTVRRDRVTNEAVAEKLKLVQRR